MFSRKEAAAARGKSGTLPAQGRPKTPLIDIVDSSHATSNIRPIGRLLQLNPDGTQLLELIRPPNGSLGVQLTQGNEHGTTGRPPPRHPGSIIIIIITLRDFVLAPDDIPFLS